MHYLMKTLPVLALLVTGVPLTATAHERSDSKANFDNEFDRTHASHQQPLHSRHGKRHDGLMAKVDVRQDRQWRRIKRGIRSGELSRKEAKKLKRQQRRIAGLKQAFLDDGRLSRKERHILMDRLDAASERIYRLKHNDRERGYHFAHK